MEPTANSSPDLEAGPAEVVPEPSKTQQWRARRVEDRTKRQLYHLPDPAISYPKPKVYRPKVIQSKACGCSIRCWPAVTMVGSAVLGGSSFAVGDDYVRPFLLGAALSGAAMSCAWGCCTGGEIARDCARSNKLPKWIIKRQAEAIEEFKIRLNKLYKGKRKTNKLIHSYQAFVENGGYVWGYRVEGFLSETRGVKSRHPQWELIKRSVYNERKDLLLTRKRLGHLKHLVQEAADANSKHAPVFNSAVKAYEESLTSEEESSFVTPTGAAGRWFKLYKMFDDEYRKVDGFFDVVSALHSQVEERVKLSDDKEIASCEEKIRESRKEIGHKLKVLKGLVQEPVLDDVDEEGSVASFESGDDEDKEESGFLNSTVENIKMVSRFLW